MSTVTDITVGICTFRRDSLDATLRSVAAQILPEDLTLHILIADNDTAPSAKPLVDRLAAELPVPVAYIHAPERNISIARNAILDNTQTDYLAFIDDDETAPTGWLGALWGEIRTNAQAAVFGPLKADYPSDTPDWIRHGDYHSYTPYYQYGEVRTGFTGNCLINLKHPAVGGKRFDLARGRTGGEDTDYFFSIWKSGGEMGLVPDAFVKETVAANRLTFDWMAPRRFRSGQSYGAHCSGADKIFAIGKYLFCQFMAALFFWSRARRNFWRLRGKFHAGVVAAAVGTKEAELY